MNRMKFSCKNCHFKFEKEVKPNVCPYCGGNKIEREKSAEEFLKDANYE